MISMENGTIQIYHFQMILMDRVRKYCTANPLSASSFLVCNPFRYYH